MERDFTKLMLSKSEKELQEYVDDRLKYTPSAVFAAIDELKKRGKFFSGEEIETIRTELEKKQELDKQKFGESSGFNSWKKNVVTDLDAPEYYSERAIYLFSVLFSVLFGTILMISNLRKTQTKKGSVEVAVFGIAYTAVQFYILSLFPRNTGITVAFSAGGAAIINYFFWKKYIGEETKYRTKAIWIPLIIALAISSLFILATIYAEQP